MSEENQGLPFPFPPPPPPPPSYYVRSDHPRFTDGERSVLASFLKGVVKREKAALGQSTDEADVTKEDGTKEEEVTFDDRHPMITFTVVATLSAQDVDNETRTANNEAADTQDDKVLEVFNTQFVSAGLTTGMAHEFHEYMQKDNCVQDVASRLSAKILDSGENFTHCSLVISLPGLKRLSEDEDGEPIPRTDGLSDREIVTQLAISRCAD